MTHYVDTLLPLAGDRVRATTAAFKSGRGDLSAVIDANADETELQLERIALEGEISRAWVFLHLLHSTEAP
jgi:hypothetical protein